MAVTVNLPGVLAKLAEGHRAVDAAGTTVGELVNDLAQRYPALGPRLRDVEGKPYEFVVFYVNDADIRLSGGFAAPVRDGDEVTVVPAVAGG
jgi:molybdopterin converting factor small subunit